MEQRRDCEAELWFRLEHLHLCLCDLHNPLVEVRHEILQVLVLDHVAGQALAIRTVLAAPPAFIRREAMSPTERVRQKRARERRGLRFVVPIKIYDGDLDLLRAFGFLAGYQMSDRAAISRAIEAFLALLWQV
jgi:hypothetical protein